ncbi:MerR family transcriptional regulator [Streptomyces somaliensis DSM 40738]|uniref:MerR family transcriptional regulator n=1 Tax=Streptomyces somaliensis (strain ATCC 33201 / DSM 40738 / JCM 12659 / KCTC 9044 / NCTC 11332 / NRRL B-12077 / IP 733) TaxID=1134445 RepID=A0AA44DCJ3_STRE0|nr:MerR family transcriptional regulator [Streptomyces somaliensis]MCQ0021866.1 MerR family transcriptional regulator [Streptomyces somaliensis DSM 40738]NKY13706.1 MerR family transcriptional regulator [Streptomyces somaliensis DSM 40738]
MRRTPTGGAGHGTADSGDRLVSIGTVLNQLREEFPEVTISKIRFLEAEGLVEPRRTASGYRKFSPGDVERLALILRMQRDHYLPLKVIREHLDALARGERVPPPSGGPRGRPPEGAGPWEPDEEPGAAARVGRAELLAAAGASEEDLAAWESYGLVVPAADGGYEAGAVTVAKLVAELGRHGLEPRHLRAVKAAAEREAGLVEQVVAPLRRHRNPQTRAHAEATARELAALSVRLHAALVRSALGVRFP